MMGNKLLITGLATILLLGIFSPLAAGANDSLHVVMTIADRNYSVGDTVTIQLRVYDKGVLVNLADLQDAYLAMSAHHNLRDPVNITLGSQGTGIYQGTYTVKASDPANLHFFYTVTLGTDTEEGRATLQVYSVQDTVQVTVGGQKSVPAKPGDSLTATVLVRTGGTPIPITGFTDLYLLASGGARQNLTHTVRDVGIYDVNVIVPAISVSDTYELVARPLGMWNSDRAQIYVNVLDVWYHKVSTAGNTVSFEVCVANNEGQPVELANIYIQRSGWPQDEYTGITDASGRCLLHVPNISGSAGFNGYVIAGGLNQTITGAVFNHVEEQPHAANFDIVWEGSQTIFGPNTQVTVPYSAYAARVPVSGKTIFFYVTARGTNFAMFGDAGSHVGVPREVVAAGSVATDSLGKFNVAFRTPARQCVLDIRLEVPLDRADRPEYDLDDDMYYASWPPNAWDTDGFQFYAYEGKLDGDKGVSLKVGNFKPGKPASVTAGLSAALGDPVYVLWGVGSWNLENTADYDPEWMRWVPAGHIVQTGIDDKGKYQGGITVPGFIEGQSVTVAAGYVDSQGIPHFDVKTQMPGGGTPWLWIGIIIAIIAVVIILIYVAKEKMVF